MSNRYPCPNPVCTHEFDPAQLAGAAAVTCPKCGMVIQLRAQPAAMPLATPATVPMARPVTVPQAQPAPPPPPVADPFAAAPAPSPGPGPIVRARKGPKGRDWLTYVALIGGFVILLGAGVGAVINQLRGTAGASRGSEPFKSTDFNIRLTPPGGTWDQNPELRKAFEASLVALQRPDPAAWFVLAARDFKDHDPSPRELDEEARAKLSYFKNVDTEPAKDAPLRTADPVAGQPAHAFAFQGELDGEHVSGECHFVRYQGIGYWAYTWKRGTVDQRNDPDFPKLREGLAVLGERPRWKEVLANRKTFTGKKGYKLTDPTGRWNEVDADHLADHDPAADLVLFATDPKIKLRPAVYLVAMSLPKAGDPVEAAKKHVLEMQKRASYDTAAIVTAPDGGAKDTVGSAKGRLLRWHVQLTPSLTRFAVAGVVPRDNDVLLLYADCELTQRNVWEAQMQAIIDTLQLEQLAPMPVPVNLPDLAATAAFGRRLGAALFPGAVVALVGGLGAGKTHLTRAVVEGLGGDGRAVSSPTFGLIHEYSARLPVYHFDAYRLRSAAEFRDLGVHEYFEGAGVCLIEWADRVSDCLPDEYLRIAFEITSETSRRLTLDAVGEGYVKVVGIL